MKDKAKRRNEFLVERMNENKEYKHVALSLAWRPWGEVAKYRPGGGAGGQRASWLLREPRGSL